MAVRNVLRYRRRTFITASAIAFGVAMGVFMNGFIAGSETETTRNLRDHETGEIKVFARGYFEDRDLLPFDSFIEPDARKAIERALAGPDSASRDFSPRVLLTCELHFAEDFFAVPGSVTATLAAVDPELDARALRVARSVSEGRWLARGDSGIVIGSWLAEDIGAKVGYSVTLECRGRGGFYQTVDAEIVGIARTDDPVVNRNGVFMDLSYADGILALDGAVTEYLVRMGNADRAAREASRLAPLVAEAGCEAYPWQKVAESTMKLLRGQRGETAIFMFFIVVIAAVGIVNTMLMAVMERKAEIGTLRALGFGASRVRALFLAEGLTIGVIGTAMGLAAGLLLNLYFVVHGMDFSFMLRDTDIGYRVTGVIRSAWDPAGTAQIALFTLATSALIAWLPSGRILRQEVADMLRK